MGDGLGRLPRRAIDALVRGLARRLPLDRILGTDTYVWLAYRLVLGRPPDPGGFRDHAGHIAAHGLHPAYVFEALATSPEYRKRHSPLHYVRTELVRRLPRADVIVDLGGSTKHMNEGALYAMGYVQKWRRLVIVDLPPRERYEEWRQSGAEAPRLETPNGPVEYVYGSMCDEGLFREEAFADLVWSGNSIEHVTEEEADRVLALARRVLKPDGHLCLDTPNRRVTRVHSPDRLTNPDHKIEYTHETLAAKLERQGFAIVEQLGVMDCRRILAGAPFDDATLRECPDFCADPRDGYFLYYRCVKRP